MKNKFTLKEVREVSKELNINLKVIPIKTLQKGMNIELEKRDTTKGDPKLTAQIAIAHLKEYLSYYKLLEDLEKAAK